MVKHIKILVIEDEESHAQLIQRAFERHRDDFDVHFVSTLAQAGDFLAGTDPDIVLCDWILPDGKGLEILAPERDNSLYPVVLMTSHGNEELAVEAMKAGALDYIVKSPEAFSNMPHFVLREIREWEHILARRRAENRLQQVLLQTVESLALLVEKRDPYTYGHQKKVSQLACAIGREMQLSDETLQVLYFSSILHDIGKITVPLEYLNKPGKLDPLEFDIIKTHPQNAYEMLKAIDFEAPVAQIILQHHEKCDGSGYPYGLGAQRILLEARILTVADVVEAISSHRPYRPSLGITAALDEIASHRGILYDTDIVEVCLKLFREGRFQFE